MKRCLAMLCAVLLIVCMAPTMAQTLTREDCIGNWTLHSIVMGGMEFPSDALGMAVTINIHEDDTVAFSMGERFCVSRVTWMDGAAAFDTPMTSVRLTMGTDGLMHASIDLDDMALELRMQRAAQDAQDATLTPFTGRWTEVRATMNGAELPGQAKLGLTMSVYDDGYALMTLPDEAIGARFLAQEGAVVLTDDAGSLYPVTLDAQGQMTIEFPDSAMVLILARETAGEDGLALLSRLFASTEPASLAGVWVCTGGVLDGVFYAAQDVGLDVTLTVREGADTLNYGGNIIEREATVTDCSVIIGGIRFELNEGGQLTYTTQVNGSVLVIYLERQGK